MQEKSRKQFKIVSGIAQCALQNGIRIKHQQIRFSEKAKNKRILYRKKNHLFDFYFYIIKAKALIAAIMPVG